MGKSKRKGDRAADKKGQQHRQREKEDSTPALKTPKALPIAPKKAPPPPPPEASRKRTQRTR